MADDTGTPVQGVPIIPLAEIRELHTRHTTLSERVIKMEGTVDRHDERLNAGSNAFSKLENQIEQLNKKINPTWPAVIAVFVALSGYIWVAARYPDAKEFGALRERVDNLTTTQAGLIEKLDSINKALEAINKRNEKIEDKLDKALGKTQ